MFCGARGVEIIDVDTDTDAVPIDERTRRNRLAGHRQELVIGSVSQGIARLFPASPVAS